LVARGILTAALMTALLAAIVNWGYERFLAPDLYAAGPPLARAIFVILLTVPFILGGLLILGIPAAWVLRRLHTQNIVTFAIAGAVTGIVWGQAVVALVRPTFGMTPYIVDAVFGATSMMLWWWMSPKDLVIP
jgi:hypothetical protein